MTPGIIFMKNRRVIRTLYVPSFLFLLAVVVYLIYSRGLNGAFLLDDLGNLLGLERVKGGGWQDAISFLSGGVGPGGRPLSLLTFLLQSESWPDPVPFRAVNILLHSFNFLLVSLFVYQVVSIAWRPFSGHGWLQIAVVTFIALAWAVAPIQLNTVEYIIQRMTILSTTFVMVGLNTWVYLTLNEKAEFGGDEKKIRRMAYVTLTYSASLIAAVFSKESGALLPVFIGVLVIFFGFKKSLTTFERRWYLFLVFAPLVAYVIFFLLNSTYYFDKAYQTRDFDVWGRLLTQPIIVLEYMQKIYFPWGQQFTLFNENYPVSTNVWQPSVLYPLAIIGSLLLLAFVVRKRQPLIGFGICFFFGGHLLESTALPLELYFEHRNYLPSLGLWITLVGLLMLIPVSRIRNCVMILTFIFASVAYSAITIVEAKVWERPLLQAARWYELNPGSHRAHGHLARTLVEHDRYFEAASLYKNSLASFPRDVSKPLLWLELECSKEALPNVAQSDLYKTAEQADYYHETINVVASLVGKIEAGACNSRVPNLLLDTLFILLANPNYDLKEVDINIAIARIFFALGRYIDSREFLERANKDANRLDITIGQIQVDLALGNVESANTLLGEAKARCNLSFSKGCLKFSRELNELSNRLGENSKMDVTE